MNFAGLTGCRPRTRSAVVRRSRLFRHRPETATSQERVAGLIDTSERTARRVISALLKKRLPLVSQVVSRC
jgi:hypothetical protein